MSRERIFGQPVFTKTRADGERQKISPLANVIVPSTTAERIFPGIQATEGSQRREVTQKVLLSEAFSPLPDVSAQFVNTTLRVVEIPAAKPDETSQEAIAGNTVHGACPHREEKGGCNNGGCLFAQTPVAVNKLQEINCAVGNTVKAFTAVHQQEGGRFALLPTNNNIIILGDDTPGTPVTLTNEDGTQSSAFFRLAPARAVVVSEQWAKERGLKSITQGIHGADANFGLMSFSFAEDNFFVAFCKIRDNLGDRTPDAQILAKSINALLDQKGLMGQKRQEILKHLKVRIDLGASARLENFAFDIQLPELGSQRANELREHLGLSEEAFGKRHKRTQTFIAASEEYDQPEILPERKKQLEQQLKIVRRQGIITSGEILDYWYPGALDGLEGLPERRGFVYGAAEAGLGLEPRTRKTCPGYKELCHFDYRGLTKATIEKQLRQIGITTINWNDELAIDPADTTNDTASNRQADLAGVPELRPVRTFNGVTITFN